jgi:TatA/E family protein of Tat protein translocase
MFGSLGAPELIIIGLIIVLLFGVGKLSGLGKDLGSSVKEFRKAIKDEDKEKQEQQQQAQAYIPPAQPAQQQYAPPPQQYAPPPQQQYTPPQAPQQQYTPPPPPQNDGAKEQNNIF